MRRRRAAMSLPRRSPLASSPALAAAVLLLLALSACGFRPIYATDGSAAPGADVPSQLHGILVPAARGRIEQLVYNDLRDRLNPLGVPQRPRYRLDYAVSVIKQPVAFARDETATRRNVRVSVTFALRDPDGEAVVFAGTARAIAAYNVLRSQYATLAGERSAEARAVREVSDEIRLRLAAYFSGAARG